jgi:alpha-1,2-mannosyltransferase
MGNFVGGGEHNTTRTWHVARLFRANGPRAQTAAIRQLDLGWDADRVRAMRMAGADLTAAYLMQGVSAISATAAVALLWYRRSPFGIKSAGLAAGVFLVTPHAYYYDMIILIFAAAWLANEAVKTGFLPW